MARDDDDTAMKARAVLFDYGNTLLRYCDFGPAAYAVRVREAARLVTGELRREGVIGPDFDPEPLCLGIESHLAAVETNAREHFVEFDASTEILTALRQHLPDLDDAWADRVDRVVYGQMRLELIHRDDALPMLRTLRERGLRVGLVSNSQFRSRNHIEDLERDGLLELLDGTVFSIDLGLRKPRREIFDAGLERVGARAEETVFVGDSIVHDIRGARDMGMQTILMWTPDNADEEDHGADAVVDSLAEIPGLLD